MDRESLADRCEYGAQNGDQGTLEGIR
jgi:hypothetical protein